MPGLITAALLVLLTAGCGSSAPKQPAASCPTPASTATQALIRGLPGGSAYSTVGSADGGCPLLVTAGQGTATVWSAQGGQWRSTATVALSDVAVPVLPGATITLADVTGDGRPDALAALQLADTTGSVVLSSHSGSWQLVPELDAGQRTPVLLSPRPRPDGSGLLTRTNTCQPNCAQGSYVLQSWHYDPAARAFADDGLPSSSCSGIAFRPTSSNGVFALTALATDCQRAAQVAAAVPRTGRGGYVSNGFRCTATGVPGGLPARDYTCFGPGRSALTFVYSE